MEKRREQRQYRQNERQIQKWRDTGTEAKTQKGEGCVCVSEIAAKGEEVGWVRTPEDQDPSDGFLSWAL